MRRYHGKSKTSIYHSWLGMKARCTNPNNPAFKNYGGRGITVCDRWMVFENFHEDMGDRPGQFTIERIDNDKGYGPDNCEWAPRSKQARNRRNLIMITMDGETHPLSVWVERYGGNYKTIHMRIYKGWDPEKAIKTPDVTQRIGVPFGRSIHDFEHITVDTADGKMTLGEAISRSGLKPDTVTQRMKRGWSVQEALALPPRKGRRFKLLPDLEIAAEKVQ